MFFGLRREEYSTKLQERDTATVKGVFGWFEHILFKSFYWSRNNNDDLWETSHVLLRTRAGTPQGCPDKRGNTVLYRKITI